MLSQLEQNLLMDRLDFSSLSGKRILITGGSGMLGGYLITAIMQILSLLGLPPAKISTISKSGNFQNLGSVGNNKSLEVVKGSVEHYIWKENFEIIVHAASPASPQQYGIFDTLFSPNVLPVEKLILGGHCLETFVFISSGTINGMDLKFDRIDQSDGHLGTLSDLEKYSYAKLLAERSVFINSSAKGIEGISIRLYPTFGPGIREDKSRATTDFLWQVARGYLPSIKSDGKSLRTFLYLEDACAVIIKSITSHMETKLFDLSGQNVISISEFASLVSEIGGLSGKTLIEHGTKVQPHFKNFTLPNLKPVSDLGMLPQVKLEDGIQRTLEWIRKEI